MKLVGQYSYYSNDLKDKDNGSQNCVAKHQVIRVPREG
jgi:hypothetical protein